MEFRNLSLSSYPYLPKKEVSLINVVSMFKKLERFNLLLAFIFKKPFIDSFEVEGKNAESNVKSPNLNSFLYWLSIKRLILDVFTIEKVKSELFPNVKKIGCLTPVPSKSELKKLGAKRPEARVSPGSGVCRYGV